MSQSNSLQPKPLQPSPLITIDLGNISRDEVLAAIRELDREAAARTKAYPALVSNGKLNAAQVEPRRLSLSTAREIVACVARGMITECGHALRVLPVLPPAVAAVTDCEDGGEA